MSYEIKEIEERISKLSDEELLRMIYSDFSGYRQEVIDIAKAEMKVRGISRDMAALNKASGVVSSTCYAYPEKEALRACDSCGRFICEECFGPTVEKNPIFISTVKMTIV
jgi:hypothetical protein